MIALHIVLIIVSILVLTAINIYLLALYCHPDDKGWGNVVYCKILVVAGLTLCQAQALMVPLDVANESALLSEGGLDMRVFWTVIYIVVLVMISVLLPYALFLYETDEDDPMKKRLCTALCYTTGAIIITVMFVFISWAVFKWVNIPYTELALDFSKNKITNLSQPITVTDPVKSNKEFELQASLAVYIMAILSFFGWILVVLFGGVGLFALPIDMINAFRHRPKLRRSAEMRKARDALTAAIESVHKEGDELQKQDQQNHKNKEGGFLSRWKTNRAFGKKLTEFKAKYYAIEQEVTIFKIELQYADSNPIIPWLKLFVGIIFTLTAILWIIQIIFGNIVKAFTGNPRPLIPFFNELLIGLQQKNAGFIATFVFAYLCLYILWAVQKGNIKFGIRIPLCCRFHPMKENETWMNSFLFNVILMLIASVGVIQLCISSFPTYTRNTDIYMIFGNTIRYMRFYSFFYDKNVFAIAFVAWSLLTLIYMLITINKKPDYMKEIQKIQQEKNYQSEKMKQ